MNYFLDVMKKYAVFSGRARRKELWMFVLANVIIGFIIGSIEGIATSISGSRVTLLGNLFMVVILLPCIAVGVRRMHDLDKSGWFVLIPIYNIFLYATEGTRGENRFGEEPKKEAEGEKSFPSPTNHSPNTTD
jgi:uncharacterized membrane protein YhaH (DUF805 family)